MEQSSKYKFYKINDTDRIMWVESESVGDMLFSFDGKKIYNLFRDYPKKLSPDEKRIFDRENPFWVKFFRDRQ